MIKTLGSHVKQFKAASIATPVFMLLEVLMETLLPFIMASIIDKGIEQNNLEVVLKMGLVMIIAAGLSLTFGILGGVNGAKASAGFARNLRKAMYENIQTFSFANIDHFSTSGLITRLTTDVTNIQNAYQMILRMCTRAPASLICAMAMSYYVNAKIANIYLITVIILGIILFVMVKLGMKYFDEVFRKYDDLNESVEENVSGIRVVKAYVREDYSKKRFGKAAENLYKLFIKAEKIVVLNMPIMQLAIYICIILISWMGAKMVVGSSLTTGELTTLLTYCMNILFSLMMLSVVFVMITLSMASARRICEVLNEKSGISDPEDPEMEVKDGSIKFDNVSFKYDSKAEDYVLKDINLDIKSGETIGLIGPTGSSKSSLVSLISRLYDVTGGRVLVGGTDVRKIDLKVLRDCVSVVLQKNTLFEGSIYDNLRWGNAQAADEECRKAAELACADEFIERMPDKYDTHIEQGGSNVSGGQKQRLCIARAILKKPKVLILDDSTSAVDTATDAKIRAAMKAYIPGTTKIIISQRISSVMDADRIIVLNEGRLDGFGTHEELLKSNEIYRDVYEEQMSGGGADFDMQ
ncbi:MAG: ABC transporter ATP-binding protein [Lachnospiraceae bacterium]|jgi:ATP-binding cassette subfamily B multidrug efflux pump|nr:ABC transporter ATP-binding protein [Lachnospiraceae bacterium]MEE3460653.1 ABC transporter ATP-binding protein [Lachnospiraceae bacterium]